MIRPTIYYTTDYVPHFAASALTLLVNRPTERKDCGWKNVRRPCTHALLMVPSRSGTPFW